MSCAVGTRNQIRTHTCIPFPSRPVPSSVQMISISMRNQPCVRTHQIGTRGHRHEGEKGRNDARHDVKSLTSLPVTSFRSGRTGRRGTPRPRPDPGIPQAAARVASPQIPTGQRRVLLAHPLFPLSSVTIFTMQQRQRPGPRPIHIDPSLPPPLPISICHALPAASIHR